MNIQHLTNQYAVRNLIPADGKMVYEALKNHTIFYKYHPLQISLERSVYFATGGLSVSE